MPPLRPDEGNYGGAAGGLSRDRPQRFTQLGTIERQALQRGKQAQVSPAHRQRQQPQGGQTPVFAGLHQTGPNQRGTDGNAGRAALGRGNQKQEIVYNGQ